MSKYKPLERYLQSAGKPRIRLTFSEVEKILGVHLPATARRHAAWWSNHEGNHVQAQAWLHQGYRTEQVDLAGQKLSFVVDDSARGSNRLIEGTPSRPGLANETKRKLRPIFGSMRGTTFVIAGVDLAEPTASEWGNLKDE